MGPGFESQRDHEKRNPSSEGFFYGLPLGASVQGIGGRGAFVVEGRFWRTGLPSAGVLLVD